MYEQHLIVVMPDGTTMTAKEIEAQLALVLQEAVAILCSESTDESELLV